MKHFSLLAKISRDHGGMTRASFRRSRALAEAGEQVEILTFNIEPDLGSLVSHVREHGELGDVLVRNMHTDFCRRPELLRDFDPAYYSLTPTTDELRSVEGLHATTSTWETDTQDFSVTEWATSTGTVRRFELRNRADELFFVDERKADTRFARRLTLFEPSTGEVRFQGSSFAFQTLWLDALIGTDLTALTIDGVAPGEAFANYTRPNVLKYLVQHTVHQVPGTDPTRGPLEPRVVAPLRHNRTFDALVTLTQAQHDHLVERISPVAPVEAIPNVNAEPDPTEFTQIRDNTLCVIVSRLEEGNKRISHMLRAIAEARQIDPRIHAEVYGGPTSGTAWDTIHGLVEELGLMDSVAFFGHQEQAIQNFARAGFTALTSRFEGQSLALVEAMSRGAIPISYDVLYGPSEIIQHRVTGFLVPPDDIAALASAMVEVAANEQSVSMMREQGYAAASRYSKSAVLNTWQDLYGRSERQLPLRERLRTARASVDAVSFRRGKPVQLQLRFELPFSRFDRRSVTFALQAVDHHTLAHASFRPETVKLSSDGAVLGFVVSADSMAGIGRRDVTAWLRTSLNEQTMDVRVTWDPVWEVWPARSPSGQLNLR